METVNDVDSSSVYKTHINQTCSQNELLTGSHISYRTRFYCSHNLIDSAALNAATQNLCFPCNHFITFHTPCAGVWPPFVRKLRWTRSKHCPAPSTFVFSIYHPFPLPSSRTAFYILFCYYNTWSAHTHIAKRL